MPDPKKAPGDVNRRRSFFSSTLVIQPPPSSTFVNVPPSHTVLAALSSPGRTEVKHTIKIVNSKPPAAQAEQTQTASSSTSGKKSTDEAETKVPSPQSSTTKESTVMISTPQQTTKSDQPSSSSSSSRTKSIKDKGKEKVPSPQSSAIKESTTRVSITQPISELDPPSSSPSSSGTKKIKDKGKEKKVPSPQSSTTKEPIATVSTVQETSKSEQPSSSSRVKKKKGKKKEKKVPSAQTTSKEDAIGKSDPSVQTDRAAKARATRLVKLANARAEREAAAANPRETTPVPEEPRRTLRAVSTSTKPSYAPPPHGRKAKPDDDDDDRVDSSPPHIILKVPKRQVEKEVVTTPLKSYMDSGMYCQDDHAKSPYKLISRVLFRREAEEKAKSMQNVHPDIQVQIINRPTFPPLPYDYGYKLFFKEVKEFLLPFDIRQEAEKGLLDGNRKPAHYDKLEANTFPERPLMKADVQAICRCDPESDCGDNCINRIMRYLCGKTCPCGERCTNKSLATRKGANVKVAYTGSRGFGLIAVEDITEDDFVIDYRGEIIGMDTYQERCENEYAISKNFYALAYDQDEVIDAGVQGNEARFINHSCKPNMVVHRYQNLGDGQEEFEVGMWALRDIAAGEELTYDYNFDAFGIAEGGARVECRCGAPNCVGFLGRKTGEKSAKQIALDIAAKEASKAKVARIKAKRPFARPTTSGSISWKGKERELDPREIAKAPNNLIHQLPTPESMDSGSFEIPPPVDFYKSPSSSTTADKDKKKYRQSLPNLSRPIEARTPQASSSRLEDSPPPHQGETGTGSTTHLTEKVRTYVRRPYGVEAPKPISGWAIWLKKQAGKFPRTEESWQELKHARRKGEDWMNGLIAEYGRLPSRGVPGQVGSVVTQRLLDEKRRELEQQGIDYTARGPRGGTIIPSTSEPVKRPRKRKRASEPARKKSSAQTDVGSAEDSDGENEAEIRRVAKRDSIKKRNGAPMGWVYEPITGPPADAVDAVPEDLPPRRKRAMTSYAE